jgi:hypothetical protein
VTWTQGATQGGSSGAALIDAATRRVVGVLTGGTTTCDVFSGADYFGRLSVVRPSSNRASFTPAMWSLAPKCQEMRKMVSSLFVSTVRPVSGNSSVCCEPEH